MKNHRLSRNFTGWIIGIIFCVLICVSMVVARGKPLPDKSKELPEAEKQKQVEQSQKQSSGEDKAKSDSPETKEELQSKQAEDPNAQPLRSEGDSRGSKGPGRFSRRPGFDRQSNRQSSADPNAPGEQLEAIQLNNIEMKDIIQKLGEWTGKPIIPVNDEIMQTKVTIYSSEKVSRERALSLLIAALYAKGVLVDQVGDTIFLKPLASARMGVVVTLSVDEPLAKIENPTQIVEKWFQLWNYSPTLAAEVVSSLTAEYGHVTADEGTGRISVIDTVENLRRIEQVIRQLDVPESEQTQEKVFELKHADPVEVVQVLEIILGEDNRNRRSGYSGRTPSGRPSGGPRGSQGDIKTAPAIVISAGEIPIRLIPMPKQRWILARGSRTDIETIESWVTKLDQIEVGESRQQVFQVRYADVREVERLVEDAIQEMPGTDMEANIVVQALRETNQIVVFGSDENRKIVEQLIAEIDLPKDDIFVTETFTLKHADPDQIKLNIEGLYETQAGSFSSTNYGYSSYSRYSRNVDPEEAVKVVSYPMLKKVVVIASEKNMTKIARQIREEWDVPLDLETDQYRILSVQNSDPVQLADLLSRLFSEDADNSSSSRSLVRMLFGGQEDEAKKKIVGSLYGTLSFEPVPDTKKIIVLSKIPEAYDVIETLVKRLDSQEMAEIPQVVTLKYADAEELCDQLNAILNEPGTTAVIRRSERGLSEYYPEGDSSASSSEEEDTGTITPWWTGQQRDEDEMPTSNLIGQVRFVPVHRSKAILVLAPPEYMDAIKLLIEELDQPGMQVMLKVAILEVNHSDVTSLGVQYASDPSAFGTLGVDAIGLLNELAFSEMRGSFSTTTTSDISVLIDLLVKNTNARILNQPTLWTKDNKEAKFVKGQKIAFIDQEQSDSSNLANTVRTFTYDDVGVTLRIRPNITPEKAVDISIHLNISQVENDLINTQVARKNLDTETQLIVNDGQSILLGGLLFQNDDQVEQKVPLLGDLPVLGGLFKHNKALLRNDELLVFITPYVIDEAALTRMPTLSESEIEQDLSEPRERFHGELEQLQEAIRTRLMESNSM